MKWTSVGLCIQKENGWEMETWHHIYYCDRSKIEEQVKYLQSACKLLNEELAEQNKVFAKKGIVRTVYFGINAYSSIYSVCIMDLKQSKKTEFGQTGYKSSFKSEYTEPIFAILQ